MRRVIATLWIVASLVLVAGCGSTPVQKDPLDVAADPMLVMQYNLAMQRRARIEAEARRRGIIIIWADAPPKPPGA